MRVTDCALYEPPFNVPQVVVYPLSDQVADKVCAMYELHGAFQNPSSRYRDLVDLALIISACEFDAVPVSRSLHSESRRRGLQLPVAMMSPGPQWPAGYSATARKTKIGMALHTMDATLEHVGFCLNPLLNGSRERGTWRPGLGWSA